MPEFLIKMLQEQYGENITKKILEGYKHKRKVTFRVNNLKASIEEIEKALNNKNIKYKKVSWYKNAFILEDLIESEVISWDIYEKGKIYLQSLSSMLPPIILGPEENADILDMTAAPGGKTTEMAALSNNKSHITACEMNKIRIEKLKYNVKKQAASCVYIMQKDSRKIDEMFSFDQILLDAPCSGSGTLNVEDKNLNKYFTKRLIEKSSEVQYVLLKKAITILKKGQEMVYSTCSILSKENEEVLLKIMKESKVEIIPIEFEGMEKVPYLPVSLKGTLCVCPNEFYEGFFIAKIRKII